MNYIKSTLSNQTKQVSQCVCDNDFEHTFECGICKSNFKKTVSKDDYFKKNYCPGKHGDKVIAICGMPGQTCSSCSEKGLRYVSGDGGPTRIVNKITGETTYCE